MGIAVNWAITGKTNAKIKMRKEQINTKLRVFIIYLLCIIYPFYAVHFKMGYTTIKINLPSLTILKGYHNLFHQNHFMGFFKFFCLNSIKIQSTGNLISIKFHNVRTSFFICVNKCYYLLT